MSHVVSWLPVSGAKSYRIRVSHKDTNASSSVYEEDYAEVNPELSEDGRLRVDLDELAEIPEVNGEYDITISAVDAKDREGHFALINDQEFLVAPLDAPKGFIAEF